MRKDAFRSMKHQDIIQFDWDLIETKNGVLTTIGHGEKGEYGITFESYKRGGEEYGDYAFTTPRRENEYDIRDIKKLNDKRFFVAGKKVCYLLDNRDRHIYHAEPSILILDLSYIDLYELEGMTEAELFNAADDTIALTTIHNIDI